MSVYVIRPGDTLVGISKRAGTTLAEIRKLNPHITDINRISVGVAINLPSKASVQRVNAVAGEAPWFQIALEELGVSEVLGSEHNPRIIEYHAVCSLKATNDETPWCSSFVNWCLLQAGVQGTGSAAARSWLSWKVGLRLNAPRVGCITVLTRGAQPWQGHVGFFVETAGNYVRLLGGNQGNSVSIAAYPEERLLGYFWPK